MSIGGFSRAAAIAGIGATEFSKNSGRSEWQLACESVLAALDDARIGVEEVDGFALFTMETNPEIAVARALGIPELKFFSRIPHGGGGACAPVQQAALAVASGVADVVVVYRAFNERSGHRFGAGPPPFAYNANTDQEYRNWINPYGLLTPAQQEAFLARRYMQQYGVTSADFGQISVLSRKHAANNPKAWFYGRPITIEDHQNSKMIADPLRLLDCCQESDGGQALVIVSTERARDLPPPPCRNFCGGAGRGSSADLDEQLLPRRHRRDARGRTGGETVVGTVRRRSRRYRRRSAVRRLHTDGAAPVGGVRVLRPR